jgi:hypothetical protein
MNSIEKKVEGVLEHITEGICMIRQDQADMLRESSLILGATLINTGAAILQGVPGATSPSGKVSGGNESPAGSVAGSPPGGPLRKRKSLLKAPTPGSH